MRVIFVNRFFYPDISATSQLLSDLAFHLAKVCDVHVITSQLSYAKVEEVPPAHDNINDVAAHRVWTSKFGRASLIGRAIDYLTFYFSATLRLLLLVNRHDVVIVMTDPPLISLPILAVAKGRGARVINWVQDVFPEVAGNLGLPMLGGPLGATLAWLRDRALAAAECNVVLGELMATKLSRRANVQTVFRVIHNWSSGEEIKPIDPVANPLRRDWGLSHKYVVGYSGNMGRGHEFEALMNAAEQLSRRDDIVFLFIGDGKQRKPLERSVRDRGLTNVTFREYQPRAMLGYSLTVPDCHIVSLKPSLEGLMVPSKLYSSLAAGRPVIFVGAPEGEIPIVMARVPFGFQVAPDDTVRLATLIERLSDDPEAGRTMGRNGRELFEREFDQPIALAKWTNVIFELNTTSQRTAPLRSPSKRDLPARAEEFKS